MSPTRTIEDLWQQLRRGVTAALHQRVDETHPLDLYAEFENPDRPGLVLLCPARPPQARQLRHLRIDQGQRADGRWWLRLSLAVPTLQPVFAGLCRDIVAFTRSGVDAADAAQAVLSRVERWRLLLERGGDAWSPEALRGLIGELVILERDVLPAHPAFEAVASWSAPLGSPQDFVLPTGARIEVKAVRPGAGSVRINGLAQLDPGNDPLTLAVVTLADAGTESEGSLTASSLIGRLRDRLATDPLALNEFDSRLAAAGWCETTEHQRTVVCVAAIQRHPVEGGFPRLVRAGVPAGILDAVYTVVLPGEVPDSAHE